MTANATKFQSELVNAYRDLFASDPEYDYVAALNTPEMLATKMTHALSTGSGNKDGRGIKRACKACSIKYNYSAIRAFLNS